MSDLCMYELDDNVWDDFGATDDRIVPRAADEYGAQLKVQGDSRKKARHEVIGVTSDANSTNKYGTLEEKEKSLHTLTTNRMLEKDPWSHIPDSMFPTSGDNDSHKEVTRMASDNPRMSSHGIGAGNIGSVGSDFCANDPILSDKCATEDNNDYPFPLNHITVADDDLSFLNNNHEDKESSDIYYGWGDIGNFEDVDRMFRSCDSTFGLGSLNNEDDLCWFSSSQVAEGSQDSLKTDKITSVNISGDMSSLHVPNKESESNDDLTPNEQISREEKHSNQHLENGGSFTQYGNSDQFAGVKHPFTCQLFSSADLQQNKQTAGPDSVNYIQTDVPYMHFSYSSSNLSSAKSENNGHSSSKNESSYASKEKRGKLYCQQDTRTPLNRNVKHAKTESQMAFCNPVTIQKQVLQSEQDEGHSEVEGVSVGNPAELDSSNARESSCVISPLDEVSLEATSFRQLQAVMGKLDIRTKLCIRDSLYRLARSAEQRHNCTTIQGGIGDDKDASGTSVTEETNKCTGFMDIETDTNPIDRSIAHLLFHRPSDPSQRPVIDTVSLKSHGMIHGFITNPPLMMSEKQVGDEETDACPDNKVLTNCDSR